MTKLTITIKTANEDQDVGAMVANVMETMGADDPGIGTYTKPIRDYNGNTVGELRLRVTKD